MSPSSIKPDFAPFLIWKNVVPNYYSGIRNEEDDRYSCIICYFLRGFREILFITTHFDRAEILLSHYDIILLTLFYLFASFLS